MNKFKDLKFVLLFLIIILVLVLFRSFNPNQFRQDPGKAVDASQNNSNSITMVQLETLQSHYLVINLGSRDKFDRVKIKNSIDIPFKNLLDKTYSNILKESKDEIILYSTDVSLTAKAWVILNQLGFRKLFILTPEANTEVFKYKFQPDSTVRLENDSM